MGSESGSHPLRPCCGKCYSSGETQVCLTAELLPLCLKGTSRKKPGRTGWFYQTTVQRGAPTFWAGIHLLSSLGYHRNSSSGPRPCGNYPPAEPSCPSLQQIAEGLSQAQHHAGHWGIPDNHLIKLMC